MCTWWRSGFKGENLRHQNTPSALTGRIVPQPWRIKESGGHLKVGSAFLDLGVLRCAFHSRGSSGGDRARGAVCWSLNQLWQVPHSSHGQTGHPASACPSGLAGIPTGLSPLGVPSRARVARVDDWCSVNVASMVDQVAGSRSTCRLYVVSSVVIKTLTFPILPWHRTWRGGVARGGGGVSSCCGGRDVAYGMPLVLLGITLYRYLQIFGDISNPFTDICNSFTDILKYLQISLNI